jgi:hypothetical protein
LTISKPKPTKMALTEPKEFHFHLDNRCAPKEKQLSTMEMEEIEMQNMPQFKAKPLNKTIFQKVVGIPKVTKKALTKHNEFNLSYKSFTRNNSSVNTSICGNSSSFFKAKPMPDFSKTFAPLRSHQASKPQGKQVNRI